MQGWSSRLWCTSVCMFGVLHGHVPFSLPLYTSWSDDRASWIHRLGVALSDEEEPSSGLLVETWLSRVRLSVSPHRERQRQAEIVWEQQNSQAQPCGRRLFFGRVCSKARFASEVSLHGGKCASQ